MHVDIAAKDKLIVERIFILLKFTVDRFFFMEFLLRKKLTAKERSVS